MSEEQQEKIQAALIALVHACTPEPTKERTDQDLRCFVMAQCVDWSDPAERMRDKFEMLFQWLKNGIQKADIKVVK